MGAAAAAAGEVPGHAKCASSRPVGRDAQLEEAFILAKEAGGLVAGLKDALADVMARSQQGAAGCVGGRGGGPPRMHYHCTASVTHTHPPPCLYHCRPQSRCRVPHLQADLAA